MKLNELKRLNNILYKYTGLGKIEKDVDASIIYHSCYYLDKILYEIYNYLIDYDVGNQAKFIEVEVKILDEDIDKDDGSLLSSSGLNDLLNLFYETEAPDGNFMVTNLFGSSYRVDNIFYYSLNITIKDAIKEHIFRDKERKTFKGNSLSSYELSFKCLRNWEAGGFMRCKYENSRFCNLFDEKRV